MDAGLPSRLNGNGSSGACAPVLVIEKDPALADIMGEVLRRAHGSVCVAGTLPEALAQLAVKPVEAVVLDTDTVLAEAGEGPRAMLREWLRACAAPPPFIFVSLRAPADDPRRFADLPPGSCCVAWVPKPFRVEQFLAAVQHTIRSQARHGPVPSNRPRCPPT